MLNYGTILLKEVFEDFLSFFSRDVPTRSLRFHVFQERVSRSLPRFHIAGVLNHGFSPDAKIMLRAASLCTRRDTLEVVECCLREHFQRASAKQDMLVSAGELTVDTKLEDRSAGDCHFEEGEERLVRLRLLVALIELAEETEVIQDLRCIEQKHRWLELVTKRVDCVNLKV